MNVHKPPRIEAPVKTVDCLISFTNSFDPGRQSENGGMKTLRVETFSPVMGGLESGKTLSILKIYRV